MALLLITKNPDGLLNQIKNGINLGSINTWDYDNDGDFTHVPPQWIYKAWMHPYTLNDKLIFGIIGQSGIPMKKDIYAVYHGRFAEMILTHFDDEIDDIKITAVGNDDYDHFRSHTQQ